MYYQCPYCDGRIINPKKNCPNCGAPSGSFKVIKELSDDKPKKQVSDAELNKRVDKAVEKRLNPKDEPNSKIGRVALFIMSQSIWIFPNYAVLIWLIVIILYNVKSLNLKKGFGKAAFILTMIEIGVCITILLVVIIISELGLLEGRG